MNESVLCTAIRERLMSIVANMQLENDAGSKVQPPQIVRGYLPPKRSGAIKDFPYLIVRPSVGSTDTEYKSIVDVKFLIGCYSEDFDGFEYAMLVLDVVRRDLLERPNLTGTAFQFELPFDWRLFDEQPWPEWMIEATCKWTIPTPQRVPDDGVL